VAGNNWSNELHSCSCASTTNLSEELENASTDGALANIYWNPMHLQKGEY